MKNILGYFSVGIDSKHAEGFFITFDFKNLITENKRYKNLEDSSFIF